MDIVRLPVAPRGRPAAALAKQTQQPPPHAAAGRVEVLAPRQRPAGASERVVQGELLDKPGTLFQSTRAFLTERSLDRAQPSERQPASPDGSRPAINRYLNHSRPESLTELTQGRSVDLMV